MRLVGCLVLVFAYGCSSSEKGTAEDGGNPFGSGGFGGEAGTGCASPGACAAPDAPSLGGTWLFALSTRLKPTDPILFLTTITASGTSWQWNLQPLHKDTREPLPAEPIVLDSNPIPSSGNWMFTIAQPLAVPGEANPITGSDIEAENVTLAGQVCGQRTFFCGDVTGQITKPIPLDLGPGSDPSIQPSSTWTLEKLSGTGELPKPIKIDCTCRPAIAK